LFEVACGSKDSLPRYIELALKDEMDEDEPEEAAEDVIERITRALSGR